MPGSCLPQLDADACGSSKGAIVAITAVAGTYPEHQRGNSAPAAGCESQYATLVGNACGSLQVK